MIDTLFFMFYVSFVNLYTATVGRMTNSNNVISTNAYDPKKSTNVWNFRTPSTRMTKKTNQQRQNIAEYFIFRFFSFIR